MFNNLKFLSVLVAIGLVSITRVNCLAQADIAVFSKMMEAEEDIDIEDSTVAKDYPSVDNIVRGLRSYQGLEGNKPFTMFVPNNAAFKKLPSNTISYFTNEENKKALDELISFHVIPNKLTINDIKSEIKKTGGRAVFKTISGFKIFAKLNDKNEVILENEAGKEIFIMGYNFNKNGGLIHIVDSVIIPFDAGLLEEEVRQSDILNK